jgi:arabinofuranan 3-O-arabinosyltransferase
MILSAGILTLASGLAFGWRTWSAFLGAINLPLYILENESSWWGGMITAYGGFRLVGIDSRTSWLLQGTVSLTAAGTVWWIWSRRTSFPVKASSLCLSALLFTPHAFSYDLAILALPLAWLGWEARRGDWTDREKLSLVIGWLLPLLSPVIGMRAGIPVAPIILASLLFVVLQRSGITSIPSGESPPLRGAP